MVICARVESRPLITKVGANFSRKLQRLVGAPRRENGQAERLLFTFSLTLFPIVLIAHPRKIVSLSLSPFSHPRLHIREEGGGLAISIGPL